MNETTILILVGMGLATILCLSIIRVWYTMWTCTKLNNSLNSVRMQIGQVRSKSKTKMDVKDDLGNMDLHQLAQLFGIDDEILDNPIIQGFLEGIMKPKENNEEGLSR